MSPGEAIHLFRASLVRRLLITADENSRYREERPFLGSVRGFYDVPSKVIYLFLHRDAGFAAHSILPFTHIRPSRVSSLFDVAPGLSPLPEIGANNWQASCLSPPRIRTRHVVAPPIHINILHRSFVEAQCRSFAGHHEENLSLYGLPPELEDSQPAFASVVEVLPGLSPRGLFASSSRDQLPKSPIVVPEPMSLIWDSAKLARLGALLDGIEYSSTSK